MLEAMSLIEYLQASPGIIIFLMFASLMALMLTGQRVFGVMGFVGVAFALVFIDRGSLGYGFNAAIKLFNWYPMLTLPMFVFMGFMLSESGIANDMYHMFHVWFGGLRGGLAVGTLLVMIMISCMNGLSVAGMAIGCSVALPELLKRNYDKRMISGVIQAGSSLGILFPPSIVLVLYGMIAREQVKDLWLAGVGPALLLSLLFFGYVVVRCRINPKLGPVLPKEQRNFSWAEKLRVLRAGILPILLVLSVIGSFFSGLTSLEESSAVGALAAFLIALFKIQLTLPGLAGVVLGIGMAVDANVIIFERFNEEVRKGRSAKAAVRAGFKNAMSAILDANVTTLIAAVVLLIFGTGSIQGFAKTLLLGVIVSMFTAIIVTRFLMNCFVKAGATNIALYTKVKAEKEVQE